MQKKLIFTVIVLSIFLLAGCNKEQREDPGQTENLIDEVEMYTNEIESLQTQNQFLNEQNQYLVATIKQAINNLSDEELLKFSQNQYIYELQVNGESISKNGKTTISEGNVEILLSEKA